MSRSPVLTEICVTSISRDPLLCISFVSNRSGVLHSHASPVVYSPAVMQVLLVCRVHLLWCAYCTSEEWFVYAITCHASQCNHLMWSDISTSLLMKPSVCYYWWSHQYPTIDETISMSLLIIVSVSHNWWNHQYVTDNETISTPLLMKHSVSHWPDISKC